MMDRIFIDRLTVYIAKLISTFFHPLLIPFYGLLIILYSPTIFGFIPSAHKKIILMIVAVNNIILPLSLIPYLKYRKLIAESETEKRSNKIIPLALTTFFYIVTIYIIMRYSIPGFIKAFLICVALISILLTLINLKWKISAHSAGAGLITALIIVLAFKMNTPVAGYLIASFILSGALLSSRLLLNAHSQAGVWSGYLSGFLLAGAFLFII